MRERRKVKISMERKREGREREWSSWQIKEIKISKMSVPVEEIKRKK